MVNRASLKNSARAVARWATRLLEAHVQGPLCTSACGGTTQTLTGKIIGWANETQIEFSVLWPVRIVEPIRAVCIRAVGLEHLRAGSCGMISSPFANKTIELCTANWKVQQTTHKRVTHVRVGFDPRHLQAFASLVLEVWHCETGYIIERFPLELLDQARTQLLRLEGVQPKSRCLWVYSGRQSFKSDLVVQSNDAVAAELTIPSSPVTRFLPEFKTKVAWHLLAGQEEFLIEEKTMIFGREAVGIKSRPLGLKNHHWFAGPGDYQIVCSAVGVEFARFRFRIINRSQWLPGLKLQRVDLMAETVSGQTVLESGALVWERHVSFRPRLHFAAATAAPNEITTGKAVLCHGQSVLQSQEFCVQFNGVTECIDLEPFSLSQLDPARQGKHIRLELIVHLETERKATWPIIVAPYNRISNFEGQLNSSQLELAEHEEAYHEILRRLG